MKKGLGSIPKSLSWINSNEQIKLVEQVKEVEATPNIPKKSTQKGLKHGWTRATFIVNQELNNKLKALAYWNRLTVKEVIHDALTQYIKDKKIKPIPKKIKL